MGAVSARFWSGRQKNPTLVKCGNTKHVSQLPPVLPKMSGILSACLYTNLLACCLRLPIGAIKMVGMGNKRVPVRLKTHVL